MEEEKMKNINIVLKYNNFEKEKIILMNDKGSKDNLSNINKCKIEKYNFNYKLIEVIKFDNNNITSIYEKLVKDYKIKAVTFTSFLLSNKYLTQINNRILIELNKLQKLYF